MISQKAKVQADACRFCWMCRHLCPVGLQTGREVNTPRAKGLLLSMVERGTAFDHDMAEVMYECLLCDACSNDCATGFEPPVFIREGRTAAVVEDLAPKKVQAVLDKLEVSGNIYGEAKPAFGADHGGEVLVYIGEVAALRAQEMAKAVLRLLDKAGVSYQVLREEPASGVMMADLMGYVEEVQETARVCSDVINGTGSKTVVVLDSYDAVFMTQQYGEWGMEIQAEVVTAASYLASLVRSGKLRPAASGNRCVTYHDDSRMARSLHEFEPARELIAAMGLELKEMFQNRELAKCCGTSLARAYMPELVAMTAKGRWEDVKRTGAKSLIVANPQVWEVMRGTVPEGLELEDLYVLFDRACS